MCIIRRPCCCSSRPFLFNEGSNFPVKSISSSPLDVFGFRTKCCWCVPLKVASVLICLLTFIWATLELLTAEKFLKRLIDDKDIVFFLKIVYWVISIGLMIAAGILLLGIMLDKYLFVNIYVWYVLVFTCLVVVVHLAGSIFAIVKMDAVTKRFAIKLALATLCGLLFPIDSE
ncbi:uncharacterized protein LOC114357632 [Ostrinia furnacalis]|uniref:uncharacterized protein LOC114357632 n=1 Tax=Ostrinia furnacalis TaxID=93504 RepID=UPI001040DCAC|nr:uncharacterized protein LOC114357632 [Ostrinia furnacalis]